MHKILPVIIKIEKCISISEDDPESIKKMKIKMSNEMINRCDKVENDEEISLMACILNPLMKQLDFLTPEQKNSAKMMLTEKALELADVPLSVKTEPTEDNPPPALPSLPSVSDPTDDDIIVQNEKCESGKTPKSPPNKKVKSIFHNEDIDDWLTDVIYVGGRGSRNRSRTSSFGSQGEYSDGGFSDSSYSRLRTYNRNPVRSNRNNRSANSYMSSPDIPQKTVNRTKNSVKEYPYFKYVLVN
ncbi:Hypothetical predicted protein [Mytilus galloprovincialis]|uniref:Uncharacterized protein n=1 Tax=Mytilus galloprovincialis TaxID=29158 RepID=A0A8B6E589_MYTGA|nr:Hypothetical predicted protein [Mytilus galloprovincialis]